MARIIDALIVTVGFDTAKFEKGQKDAQEGFAKTRNEFEQTGKTIAEESGKVSQGFAAVTTNLIAFLAVIESTRAFESFIAGINAADAALGRLAANLGLGVKTLGGFAAAAREAGQSPDKVLGTVAAIISAFRDINLSKWRFPKEFQVGAARVGMNIPVGMPIEEQLRKFQEIILKLNKQFGRAEAHQFAMYMPGMSEDFFNTLIQAGKPIEPGKFGPSQQDVDISIALERAWGALENQAIALGRQFKTAIGGNLKDVLESIKGWFDKHSPDLIESFTTIFTNVKEILKQLAVLANDTGITTAILAIFGLLKSESKIVADAIKGLNEGLETIQKGWHGFPGSKEWREYWGNPENFKGGPKRTWQGGWPLWHKNFWNKRRNRQPTPGLWESVKKRFFGIETKHPKIPDYIGKLPHPHPGAAPETTIPSGTGTESGELSWWQRAGRYFGWAGGTSPQHESSDTGGGPEIGSAGGVAKQTLKGQKMPDVAQAQVAVPLAIPGVSALLLGGLAGVAGAFGAKGLAQALRNSTVPYNVEHAANWNFGKKYPAGEYRGEYKGPNVGGTAADIPTPADTGADKTPIPNLKTPIDRPQWWNPANTPKSDMSPLSEGNSFMSNDKWPEGFAIAGGLGAEEWRRRHPAPAGAELSNHLARPTNYHSDTKTEVQAMGPFHIYTQGGDAKSIATQLHGELMGMAKHPADDKSYLPPERFRQTPADKERQQRMDADPIRQQLLHLPPPKRNLK